MNQYKQMNKKLSFSKPEIKQKKSRFSQNSSFDVNLKFNL